MQQATLGLRNCAAQSPCRLDPFPNHDLRVRKGHSLFPPVAAVNPLAESKAAKQPTEPVKRDAGIRGAAQDCARRVLRLAMAGVYSNNSAADRTAGRRLDEPGHERREAPGPQRGRIEVAAIGEGESTTDAERSSEVAVARAA